VGGGWGVGGGGGGGGGGWGGGTTVLSYLVTTISILNSQRESNRVEDWSSSNFLFEGVSG
jgi:hypothetical protein